MQKNMKRCCLLVWLIFSGELVYGQATGLIPDIKSPNVAGLGTFGNIPVSLFTGTPDISIPLAELKGKELSLSLALRYHSGNTKPNQRGGWVGTGWNMSTGTIYREVRGLPDEMDCESIPQTGYYYRRNLTQDNWYQLGEAPNLSGVDRIIWHRSMAYYTDLEPDIFHFNVMGLQGSFFLDQNGNWRVQSDQYVTVELDPAAPFIDPLTKNCFRSTNLVSKTFNKFILKDGAGNKYVFGGVDAIEYTSTINVGTININNFNQEGSGITLQASAWAVTEIQSPDQVEVMKFAYERGPYVSSLYKFAVYNQTYKNSSCRSYSYSNWRNGGALILPLYLRKVTLNDQKIEFSISKSDELNYTQNDYYDMNLIENYLVPMEDVITFSSQYVPYYSGQAGGTFYDKIVWMKLDSIRVFTNNTLISTTRLGYNNTPAERLFLQTITRFHAGADQAISHSFTYNQKEQMPNYLRNITDHWGFDNGNLFSFSFSPSSIFQQRQPNSLYVTRGLLKEIRYPTGGKSVLDYQGGDYSKIIDKDNRQTLLPESGLGGVRIWKVRSYDENDSLVSAKEYLYSKNAVNGGQTSSGILNNKPLYFVENPSAIDMSGGTFSFSSFKSSSVESLTDEAGIMIGYSEVTEVVHGGDAEQYRTEYFTNHDNGYADENPVYNYKSDLLINKPVNSRAFERGRLLKTIYFDNDKNKVKSLRNTWKTGNPASGASRALLFNYLDVAVACNVEYYYPSSVSYLNYYYPVTLQSTADTLFANGGFVVKNTEFEYDPVYKLLVKSKFKSSNEDTLKTYFRYPADLVGVPSSDPPADNCLRFMVRKNILSEPVEEIRTVVKNNQEYLTSVTTKFYKAVSVVINGQSGTAVKLSKENQLELQTQVLKSSYQNLSFIGMNNGSELFNEDPRMKLKHAITGYNNSGQPVEYFFRTYQKPESYLWDKFGLYILASVKGAQASDIAYSSFERGNEKGGWTYQDTTVRGVYLIPGITRVPGAASGNNVFSLSEDNYTITRSNLDAAKKYTVSFIYWGTTAPMVNGTLKKDVPVANGSMRYAEYEVSGTGTVTVGGNVECAIDELRLYPANSRMVTYTYDTAVGMTSMTDEKGMTTYFEYDNFQRLMNVKDRDGKIVKHYDYHYQEPL